MDSNEIRIEMIKAMAICSLMIGVDNNCDLSGETVQALGLDLMEKLQNINKLINN